MPILLFLNEKSTASTASPAAITAAMVEFVRVLREVRRWREIALVTRTPLLGAELATGYYYRTWAADNRNHDQRLFIKALQNRAPFATVFPPDHDPGAVEYECRGETVEGIGAAHLLDGLAVSLPISADWSGPWLETTVRRLGEAESGDLTVEETTESVRHGSTVADVSAHETWGRSTGISMLESPSQLWRERADFFPQLQFLPRVQEDLEKLQLAQFIQVRGLLDRLQRSAALWDPAAAALPDWQGAKVTPEHQQRRLLCMFRDLDGTTRCFDWHGRFTPGAGRLHFRLVHAEKALRIAYVGPKRV